MEWNGSVPVQAQANHKKDRDQIRIQLNALRIINPAKQNARIFRDEYDKALTENASLKTAAAGNEEVRGPVHSIWVLIPALRLQMRQIISVCMSMPAGLSPPTKGSCCKGINAQGRLPWAEEGQDVAYCERLMGGVWLQHIYRLPQVAKSLAKASSEMDQLRQRIASLEKELGSAKAQNEKLQVRRVPVLTVLTVPNSLLQ